MRDFVSSRAAISESALLGGGVRIYGQCSVGARALIEDGVVLGHPQQVAVERLLAEDPDLVAPDERAILIHLYERATLTRTSVGDHCVVRSGTVVYESCSIGDHAQVAHHTVVREGSRIGRHVMVLPHTSIRRLADIRSGARVGGVVADRSFIGEYATSLGTLVHDFKHAVGGGVEAAPTIERGAVVGRQAVVVGGVTVGEFAVVGAGAVIHRDVPPQVIVAGNPARVVGRRPEDEIARVRQRMERGEFL